MSFIKKMRGMVIITNVEDTEAAALDEPDSTSKKKSKKRKAPQPTEDPMADLTEEAMSKEEKKDLEFKKKPSCMDHVIFHEKLRIIYVVLLCLFLGLAIPYILANCAFEAPPDSTKGYCGLNISYRMECLPGARNMSEEKCNEANCCFNIQFEDPYAPLCFHTIPAGYNYFIQNSSATNDTIITPVKKTKGLLPLTYKMQTESFNLGLLPINKTTPTDETSWPLKVLFQRKGSEILRIKIWDPTHDQDIDDDFYEEPPKDWLLDVSVDDMGGDFNLTVTRYAENGQGEEIFNTVFGPLIFSENYMEITARIPTTYLYGLGQNGNYELIPSFQKRDKWTLFNTDTNENSSMSHSSHPFYMNFERSGKIHGVYLHNAAPVEISVSPAPAVIFRALGGSFDFRFFAGPTPKDVTRQYTETVGLPTMPPFWALGYHLCRTADNPKEFDSVFEGMVNQSLPYESDCIDARLTYPGSFTAISQDNENRIQFLQESGRKFWLVQYPFLTPNSDAYKEAEKSSLLLQVMNGTNENATSIPYYGKIDNQVVGYPDFINNDIFTWMSSDTVGIRHLYTQADGIMIFQNSPMNEVHPIYLPDVIPLSEFCNETYPQFCCPAYPVIFLPAGVSDLNNKTLCASIEHPTLNGEAKLHLRSHNAYGRYQHQRTYEFKKSLGNTTRPLVTSQSTFAGSGSFGGHFGGNYQADLVSQQRALTHILQMGLYGIPFSGVPICGNTNSTDGHLRNEWCIRGHQLSAFLPFMMSYYSYNHSPRNPTDFAPGFSEQIRYFIRLRYMILPYLYELFYEAHTTGVPVARPLFYEFPDDIDSRAVKSQYMLGKGLLVTGVFQSIGDGESVNPVAHFPPGCWYDFYKGTLVSNSKNGEDLTLPTLLGDMHVHLLGGTIVPLQGNLHEDFNTTEEFRQKSLLLMVALPCELTTYTTTTVSTTSDATINLKSLENQDTEEFKAYGHLYMDDGVTPMDQNPPYHNLIFEANPTSLNITRLSPNDTSLCPDNETDPNPIGFTTVIGDILIFGVPRISIMTMGEVQLNFTQETESNTINVNNVDINWCENSETIITWELEQTQFAFENL